MQNALAIFKVDLSWLPSVNCILKDWTFHAYLLAYSVGTLGFVSLLGIPALASVWLFSNADLKSKLRRRFARSLYLFIFLFYPIVSQYILSMLRCVSILEETDSSPYWQERSLLAVDYRIDCETEPHTTYKTFNWFAIGIWPVGMLLFQLGSLVWFDVPNLAKRKIHAARIKCFVEFCHSQMQSKGESVDGSHWHNENWHNEQSLEAFSMSELERLENASSAHAVREYKEGAESATGVKSGVKSAVVSEASATTAQDVPAAVEPAEQDPAPAQARSRGELVGILHDRSIAMEEHELIALPTLHWEMAQGWDDLQPDSDVYKEGLAVDYLGCVLVGACVCLCACMLNCRWVRHRAAAVCCAVCARSYTEEARLMVPFEV